jgi:hypothetical protein
MDKYEKNCYLSVQGYLQRSPKWGWEYNIENYRYVVGVFRCLWFSISVYIGREDIAHMVQANKQIDNKFNSMFKVESNFPKILAR